ncbi:MAG: hypothetical protein ACI4IV_04380, partial [Acutalibacteraceae bacterium]
KITDIDYDKKRVSLSIRALLPEEPVEAADDNAVEMPSFISTDDAESIAKAAQAIAAEEAAEEAAAESEE